MTWMCEVGTFDCRRQDCKKVPGEDCTRCEMPDLKPRTSFLVSLYNRCQKHHCLPYPGSLLEQPAWIMDLFDTIDASIEKWRRNKDDEERRKEVLRQQEIDLKRRIGK